MMRYLLDLPPTQQQSPRIVTSLVGNLYKPSFATLSGWGRFQDIQIYSILPSVHLFSTSTHHLLIVLVVSKSLSPDWLKKVPQMALFSRRKDVDFPFTWYPLEVQRLFFEWFFRKDYCFSRDLQSTIQGDYSFYGLWLPGWWKCVCVCSRVFGLLVCILYTSYISVPLENPYSFLKLVKKNQRSKNGTEMRMTKRYRFQLPMPSYASEGTASSTFWLPQVRNFWAAKKDHRFFFP